VAEALMLPPLVLPAYPVTDHPPRLAEVREQMLSDAPLLQAPEEPILEYETVVASDDGSPP